MCSLETCSFRSPPSAQYAAQGGSGRLGMSTVVLYQIRGPICRRCDRLHLKDVVISPCCARLIRVVSDKLAEDGERGFELDAVYRTLEGLLQSFFGLCAPGPKA